MYTDESRERRGCTGCSILRQQKAKADGPAALFASRISSRRKRVGVRDWIGAFAVTAGIGIETQVARVRSAARRLRQHHAARRWRTGWPKRSRSACTSACGASSGATRRTERLTNDELIRETYRGIRPAPGYPACPDHTGEGDALAAAGRRAQDAGIRLTENFAMYPTAAVSGWYFSHPDARYFGVGKIDRDQVEDYARRKGWTLDEASAGSRRCLGYEERTRAA